MRRRHARHAGPAAAETTVISPGRRRASDLTAQIELGARRRESHNADARRALVHVGGGAV